MGLFDGFEKFGVNVNSNNVFGEEKKPVGQTVAATPEVFNEASIVYDREVECPVCDKKFMAKTLKTGKTKLIRQDLDLRPVYENVEPLKYEILLCPECGYAATNKFRAISDANIKLVKQQITPQFMGNAPTYKNDRYSFEEAYERYRYAILNSMVKNTKDSEKSFLFLRAAWLLRSWIETITDDTDENKALKEKLTGEETELTQNAYKGFQKAVQTESFPICGMDEIAMDLQLAALAYRFNDLSMAGKLVGNIITSQKAAPRVKEKAIDLKELIIKKHKEK